MIIKLTRHDWAILGLDDPARYERAIAAFYCGYGINWIRRLLDVGGQEEWDHINDLATMLGMDLRQDQIIH